MGHEAIEDVLSNSEVHLWYPGIFLTLLALRPED